MTMIINYYLIDLVSHLIGLYFVDEYRKNENLKLKIFLLHRKIILNLFLIMMKVFYIVIKYN